MRLLLVEDETRMAQVLCEILRQEKYQVDHFATGPEGLAALESGIYDLIVLDVMLPGLDGCQLAARARKLGIRSPILMLSARAELEDKVQGLDSGADDYLTKPFMARELLARLRALQRRSLPSADGCLRCGDLCLDTQSMLLSCGAGDRQVRLSEKEFCILSYLMANRGRVLSREQLALKIWGYENRAEYNNVEVYMSFTRKKLAFVGSSVEIKALRGLGYELRCGDV